MKINSEYEEDEQFTGEQDRTWTKVCDFNNPADDEAACVIDTKQFGSYCYKSQLYGFDDGKPCIFIRVNKVGNVFIASNLSDK